MSAEVILHTGSLPAFQRQSIQDALQQSQRRGTLHMDLHVGDDTPDTAIHADVAQVSFVLDDAHPAFHPVFRRAVISMRSTSHSAEHGFRTAVVALDALDGTDVEGISPLYHVSTLDGPDAMVAVVQITTSASLQELKAQMHAISAGMPEDLHAGVTGSDVGDDDVDLSVVSLEGSPADVEVTNRSAAVLAPWLDMDPDARWDGTPVSSLLATAPDVDRIGRLYDNWIMGDVS